MLVIDLGQLKSSVLHVKDWFLDTLTALSQNPITFASLITRLALHWQHRWADLWVVNTLALKMILRNQTA